jgi:hypothetical protein
MKYGLILLNGPTPGAGLSRGTFPSMMITARDFIRGSGSIHSGGKSRTVAAAMGRS